MNKQNIQILEYKVLLDSIDIYILKYGETISESKKKFGDGKELSLRVDKILKKFSKLK